MGSGSTDTEDGGAAPEVDNACIDLPGMGRYSASDAWSGHDVRAWISLARQASDLPESLALPHRISGTDMVRRVAAMPSRASAAGGIPVAEHAVAAHSDRLVLFAAELPVYRSLAAPRVAN